VQNLHNHKVELVDKNHKVELVDKNHKVELVDKNHKVELEPSLRDLLSNFKIA
jgi:uncharacterized HAD superfamily protein